MQEKRISEEDWEEYLLEEGDCDIEIEKRRALDLVSECMDLCGTYGGTDAPETFINWEDFSQNLEGDVRALRKYATEQQKREIIRLMRLKKSAVDSYLKCVNCKIEELQTRIDHAESQNRCNIMPRTIEEYRSFVERSDSIIAARKAETEK